MQFSRYNIRLTHLTSRLNFYKPMGLSGLEPPTSRLSGVRSNQLSYKPILKSFDFSGDEEIRTLDPLLARQVLSQLSYTPMFCNQLFSILITCLHAIMPSMIPMHVTPLKRCGSTLIKGNPIFISFIILNSAVYPVSMLFSFHGITLSGNGLKWTRTTDLTLIRRAL